MKRKIDKMVMETMDKPMPMAPGSGVVAPQPGQVLQKVLAAAKKQGMPTRRTQ